jgi:glycosyltransferase involved in cell wall biosynthesis
MKLIALVEPMHSHEEVLYPWIELLHGKFEVHVVAPQSLLAGDLLHETRHLYQSSAFSVASRGSRLQKLMGIYKKYKTIKHCVDKINPQLVIINTVATLLDAVLILWMLRKYNKIQVIHNFQAYMPIPCRFIYKSFDSNIVLSEQVYRYITQCHPAFDKLNYVLPIFFKDFISADIKNTQTPSQCNHPLKIGVFGTIDQRRKNYNGLIDALECVNKSARDLRFHVYLIGKDVHNIAKKIKRNGLEDAVTTYNGFIPFQKSFALLRQMDLVLFLIDNTVPNARYYNRFKISGTSILMKIFKKVGVSSTDFIMDESLISRCFFYDKTDIKGFLVRLNNGSISDADILAKVANLSDESEYSFERQQSKLISIIEGVINEQTLQMQGV